MVLDIRDSTLSSLINANTANVQVRCPLNVDRLPEGAVTRWQWSAFVLTSVFSAFCQLWWYWIYCTLLSIIWLAAFTMRVANPHWAAGDDWVGGTTILTLAIWMGMKAFIARRAAILAWKTGRYRDTTQFNEARRKWSIGATIYASIIALIIALVIAFR